MRAVDELPHKRPQGTQRLRKRAEGHYPVSLQHGGVQYPSHGRREGWRRGRGRCLETFAALPMDALWYTAPWTVQCLRAGTAGKETRQFAAAGVGVGDPPPPREGGGSEQGGKEVAPVNQNSPQSIAPGPLSARMSWREDSSLPRCCAPGVCQHSHSPDG